MHEKIDFIVSLSNESYNAKIKAFSKYTSQEKVIKGMINNIDGMAKVRGYKAGTTYAEGFKRISLESIVI